MNFKFPFFSKKQKIVANTDQIVDASGKTLAQAIKRKVVNVNVKYYNMCTSAGLFILQDSAEDFINKLSKVVELKYDNYGHCTITDEIYIKAIDTDGTIVGMLPVFVIFINKNIINEEVTYTIEFINTKEQGITFEEGFLWFDGHGTIFINPTLSWGAASSDSYDGSTEINNGDLIYLYILLYVLHENIVTLASATTGGDARYPLLSANGLDNIANLIVDSTSTVSDTGIIFSLIDDSFEHKEIEINISCYKQD